MNCQRAEGLFSAYREEELPLAEKNSLARHLESCASCKREYEEFVHTLELMHSLPHLEAPADFTDKVLARVRSGAAVDTDPWWQRVLWSVTDWSDSVGWKPAYAAAAAVLVVAVAAFGILRILDQGAIEPGQNMAGIEQQAVDRGGSGAQSEVTPPADEEGGIDDVAVLKPIPDPAVEEKAEDAPPSPEGRGDGPPAVASDPYPVVPDTLFDHEYDFEFALDRFYFEQLPDDSGAGRMYPLPASKGRPASITF